MKNKIKEQVKEMSKVRIIGNDVPEMPWQERPAENRTNLPLWRYRENPIIGRNPVEGVARIFNSAVIPYEGAYIGVFRGNRQTGFPLFIWEEAKTASTGILKRIKSGLWMKRETNSCRVMHMTQDW